MRRALAERPDLVVLVDSPDFNLPLARRAKRLGVPVFYYVSPQVWAWRSGRVRKIAKRVDRLAVIFPFEPDFYAGTGLSVDFVGHPLMERMRRVAADTDRARAREALRLDPAAVVVVLLPGSRRNELRFGLDLQLECARLVAEREPRARFVVALPGSLARDGVEARVRASGLPADLVQGRTYEAVRAADVALAKPGTVTLEVALLGCPLVVAARAHPLSAALARRVIRVPSFTMVNLVAGAPVVPEFLQEQARPERIAEALLGLVSGPARALQLLQLARVCERLGRGGAAERAAAIAAGMVGRAGARA
jgi:lipid-A-disaccharide synthase